MYKTSIHFKLCEIFLLISPDKYIIVDTVLPKFSSVVIDGGLEFSANNTMDIVLEADYILVTGRVIAGWDEEHPYSANLEIRLRGSHSSATYPSNGIPLGAKFLGKYLVSIREIQCNPFISTFYV